MYQEFQKILKQLISIFLISGLLSTSFTKLFLFSSYLLNKEEITNKFCENKSKPKLKCNGKCHLKKQLKEQEKHEDQSKSTIKEIYEIQLFSHENIICLNAPFIKSIVKHWSYNQKLSTKIISPFFHPPTC